MTGEDIASIFREEHGRAVSVLVRVLGDIDLAEDAVEDAFTVAVERWPSTGLPPSPAGWIITTARNRAVDRLRREATRDSRQAQSVLLHASDEPREEGPVQDDGLRLIFTCCHPALAQPAQVALTLRLLGGLTTPEIARAFLVPEATMAQRITRAKQDPRCSDPVPPSPRRRPARPARRRARGRLPRLHRGPLGDLRRAAVRQDLCAEAIRLGRLLVELMPDEPEAAGLRHSCC